MKYIVAIGTKKLVLVCIYFA